MKQIHVTKHNGRVVAQVEQFVLDQIDAARHQLGGCSRALIIRMEMTKWARARAGQVQTVPDEVRRSVGEPELSVDVSASVGRGRSEEAVA